MRAKLFVFLLVLVSSPIVGCRCGSRVGVGDDQSRFTEAADHAIDVIFHRPLAEACALWSSRIFKTTCSVRGVSIAWWKATLGDCTKLRKDEVRRFQVKDGRRGVEGPLECAAGLAHARFVFETIDGRPVLSQLFVDVPESIERLRIVPERAETFAIDLVRRLQGGDVQAFRSSARRAGAVPEVVREDDLELLGRIGKVLTWDLRHNARLGDGERRIIVGLQGESGRAIVDLFVIELDGQLRLSGFQVHEAGARAASID